MVLSDHHFFRNDIIGGIRLGIPQKKHTISSQLNGTQSIKNNILAKAPHSQPINIYNSIHRDWEQIAFQSYATPTGGVDSMVADGSDYFVLEKNIVVF